MVRKPPRSKPAPTGPAPGRSAHLIIGELGEDLVADWILVQGGTLLAQRWHCQTGELDLVALLPEGFSGATELLLAFIEVKTRRRGNWDQGGLLAITPQKQNKLWRTAQFFLKKHPEYKALPCRFDVALVQCQAKPAGPSKKPPPTPQNSSLPLGQSLPMVRPADLAGESLPLPESIALEQNRLPLEKRQPIQLGETVIRGDYRLKLQQYLVDAFTL